MAEFAYQARTEAGESVAGTLLAADPAEARRKLRNEGKYATSITPAKPGKAAKGAKQVRASGSTRPAGGESRQQPGAEGGRRAARGRLKKPEVISLSTQLAIMLETGVPLTEALRSVADQTIKPDARGIIEQIAEHVEQGGDLSTALAEHPRSFSPIYVALIRASEKSGQLTKMLQRATDYLKDEHEIARKLKGALMYPGIMLSFAVLTTTFLVAFVLPRFAKIYEGKEAALPVPTKLLLGLSDLLVTQWYLILPGLVVAVFVGRAYFRSPPGRATWHGIQLWLPLLGGMYRKMHLARGVRMIGTMAAAGVNLLDAVETARGLCGNARFVGLWDEVLDEIRQGKQMSEPLFASRLVPKGVAQMIASGEKGGRLAQTMEQVATFSESELKEKISEVTRYVEPLMIVMMGALIGGVVMAMLLPISTISRVMSH